MHKGIKPCDLQDCNQLDSKDLDPEDDESVKAVEAVKSIIDTIKYTKGPRRSPNIPVPPPEFRVDPMIASDFKMRAIQPTGSRRFVSVSEWYMIALWWFLRAQARITLLLLPQQEHTGSHTNDYNSMINVYPSRRLSSTSAASEGAKSRLIQEDTSVGFALRNLQKVSWIINTLIMEDEILLVQMTEEDVENLECLAQVSLFSLGQRILE